jgi:serine/threonine-protein kinase
VPAGRRASRRAEKAERRAARDAERAVAASTRTARPRRRRLLAVLVVVALVAAAAAGWWFLVRVPVHDVPDLVGDDIAAATAAAEQLGWIVDDRTEARRDGTVPGEVLDQDPEVGATLAEGEVLRLTVSLGPTLAAVPAVAGQDVDAARQALADAGFAVGEVRRTFDEEVPAEAVVAASPADSSVTLDSQGRAPKETVFDLVVSDGPAPRSVPEGLQGARATDAEAALEAVQLTPRRNEAYSEVVPEGFVISVSEPAGVELARGADVVLEVSLGPAPIVVPDVRFNSGAVAAQLLEQAGFTVSGIEGSPSGMVLATDPPAGEQHPRGTAVRIFTRN